MSLRTDRGMQQQSKVRLVHDELHGSSFARPYGTEMLMGNGYMPSLPELSPAEPVDPDSAALETKRRLGYAAAQTMGLLTQHRMGVMPGGPALNPSMFGSSPTHQGQHMPYPAAHMYPYGSSMPMSTPMHGSNATMLSGMGPAAAVGHRREWPMEYSNSPPMRGPLPGDMISYMPPAYGAVPMDELSFARYFGQAPTSAPNTSAAPNTAPMQAIYQQMQLPMMHGNMQSMPTQYYQLHPQNMALPEHMAGHHHQYGMPMGGSVGVVERPSAGGKGKTTGRRYNTHACDSCRRQHQRCFGDGVNPCMMCLRRNDQCTYSARRRRGPRPSKTGVSMAGDLSASPSSASGENSPLSAACAEDVLPEPMTPLEGAPSDGSHSARSSIDAADPDCLYQGVPSVSSAYSNEMLQSSE